MSTAAARRPSPARSPYDRLTDALAAQRCVILDGAAATHRRHVQAGCNVVRTHTRGLLSPTSPQLDGRPLHWIELARRGVRNARAAIAQHARQDDVAVAFAIDPEVDDADGAATIGLLARALADEPPDLLLVEGLAVLGPTLETTVKALLALDLPVWLSFRRCRDGLCGPHGRHWGGPEGDAFGRAARRFEELGIAALLLGCIPPDHVEGIVSYLRDFTDLPLGVHPNLGYPTSSGWRSDAGSDDHYARMALRWREEGAQIVGGCCGVGPGQIAAARQALAGTRPGRRREDPRRAPARRATPVPAPWRDDAGRSLYPLAFPQLIARGNAFVPTQGSFLVWRHLFNEGIGRGARCLDVGCGSGLQTIQLARNGATHVHGIDIDPDAVEATLLNAFRNGVAARVSAAPADLYEWVPETRYDVIVASLFQLPVNPLTPDATHHPADFWGRTAVDHMIGLLPQALAEDGVAYLLQVSILSQQRTDEVLDRHGLQGRVADFGFLPFTENFRRVAEQVAHVERISDAHHLDVAGNDMLVAYLLEIRHRLSEPPHE